MPSLSNGGSPADPVDGDCIEVKGEGEESPDLDEKLAAIKVENVKEEDPVSGASTPSLSASKPKLSRSTSAMSSKSLKESQSPVEKNEEVVGGEVTVKQEPGQPPKLARSTTQKIPARVAPLYDHLPDATDEATSTFALMDICTYSNKWLGFTEHAMECDCTEEWGKSDPSTACSEACLHTFNLVYTDDNRVF